MKNHLLYLFVVGCSADIPLLEKLFCKIAKTPGMETKVETAACKEMETIEPKITDSECKKYFEEGWSALEAKCPTSLLEAYPSPSDIAKMIEQEFCLHANDTSMEDEVATGVCTAVNSAAPSVPVSVCELTVKKGWSELAAECPKALLSSPIDIIEQAFCKISKNTAIEQKAETVTCDEMKKIDPSIPEVICKKFFEEGWSKLAAKCPSDIVSAYPSPADVAKWMEQEFCSHSGDESLENQFVTEACTLANQAVPQVPVAVCETTMKEAWTELAAQCPKQLGQERSISSVLKKAFCMIAHSKPIETKAEVATCKMMEDVEPKIPDAICKRFFEAGWSRLEEKCPSSFGSPSPADVAKWVEEEFCSHAGDSSLESEFTTTACTLANEAVPQIPVSVCEYTLKEGWSQLAAECPATTTPSADVLVV